MPSGLDRTLIKPGIALKARPTQRQLADRLRAPWPDGLEIYLDAQDIDGQDWQAVLLDQFAHHSTPPGFTFLVEGPVRSLDGEFFDLTVDSEANREVVDRLASFGGAISAVSACVHLISPTYDLAGLVPEDGLALVDACLPLARRYVARCLEAGLTPTIENVPPIARMRESLTMTSRVGTQPEHLLRLLDHLSDLRVTFDTSHAQLFLNAIGGSADLDPELRPLTSGLASSSRARSIQDFVAPLAGRISTAHVSDADGILGEGLPYGDGTMDLDAVVDLLLPEARWLVAEILEPDPDRSDNMRAAAARMRHRRECHWEARR